MVFRVGVGSTGAVGEGVAAVVVVARSADEEARHFIWRMGTTTRGPREYMNPVGYRTQVGEQVAARRAIRPLIQQSYEELKENYHIVAGTPDTVLGRSGTFTTAWVWST